jgi:hypothetical protein
MSPPRQPANISSLEYELPGKGRDGVSLKRDDVKDERQGQKNEGNLMASNASELATIDQDKMDESQRNPDISKHETTEILRNVEAVEHEAPHGTFARTPGPTTGQDAMESSTATLKPELGTPPNLLQNLSPDDQLYRDSTPRTPLSSQPPSRSTSSAASIPMYHRTTEDERSPTRSDADFDEKNTTSEDERDADSRTEIQSIMDQFGEEGQGPGHEEVMSPRLEFAGPLLGSPMQHPPRKSSLEPLNTSSANAVQGLQDLKLSSSSPSHQARNHSEKGPAVPPKPGSMHNFGPGRVQDDRFGENPLSPPMHRPPPPEPEPEPDLPFDFHRFLEQLRHRTADPVAKFLRSFLQEFGKKQWMVHEQVKIIGDFLSFITNKMAQCEVWREVSDAEFDNAREGMEKLVMNRLYTQTFSPAIPPPQPIPGSRPRRRGVERPMGPGRRGQHQEDVERDDILAQKVSIYGWIREEHLDIPPVGDSGKRFLILAQQGRLQGPSTDYND